MGCKLQCSSPLWQNVIKPVFERNKKVCELFVEDIESYSKIVAGVRIYYVHGNKKDYLDDQHLDINNVIKMGKIIETGGVKELENRCSPTQ